jgi:hypothetical protein
MPNLKYGHSFFNNFTFTLNECNFLIQEIETELILGKLSNDFIIKIKDMIARLQSLEPNSKNLEIKINTFISKLITFKNF